MLDRTKHYTIYRTFCHSQSTINHLLRKGMLDDFENNLCWYIVYDVIRNMLHNWQYHDECDSVHKVLQRDISDTDVQKQLLFFA